MSNRSAQGESQSEDGTEGMNTGYVCNGWQVQMGYLIGKAKVVSMTSEADVLPVERTPWYHHAAFFLPATLLLLRAHVWYHIDILWASFRHFL